MYYTTGNIFIDEPDNILEITIDDYDETCALLDAYAVVFPTGGTSPYTFSISGSQSMVLILYNTRQALIIILNAQSTLLILL